MKKVIVVIAVVVVVGFVVWGLAGRGGSGTAPETAPMTGEIYEALPPQAREHIPDQAKEALEKAGSSEEAMERVRQQAPTQGEAAEGSLGERKYADEALEQIPIMAARNLPPADKKRWEELHGQELGGDE